MRLSVITSIVASSMLGYFATAELRDCDGELNFLENGIAACGIGEYMQLIMDGTIKPVGMPNAKEDCPPMDQFKGVLDEIGNNFDCMLKTANWIDENGNPDDEKIAEFFNSLDVQEAIKVDNCIK